MNSAYEFRRVSHGDAPAFRHCVHVGPMAIPLRRHVVLAAIVAMVDLTRFIGRGLVHLRMGRSHG
jgi:hypothetical protein